MIVGFVHRASGGDASSGGILENLAVLEFLAKRGSGPNRAEEETPVQAGFFVYLGFERDSARFFSLFVFLE